MGVEVSSSEITPLAQSIWSQESPNFTSENDEIISLMQRVWRKTESRGVFVMDRGGDRRELYKEFIPNGYRFLIRQRGDRHLLYRGKELETRYLADICNLPYAERVVREKDGKETVFTIEFGYLTVRLPEFPSVQLYLVVIKGFGAEPMMLLTTELMRKNLEVLWWALDAYITRWRIEETIPFHQTKLSDRGCPCIDI